MNQLETYPFVEVSFDDIQGLLVESLVFVLLECLNLVQAPDLLNHHRDLLGLAHLASHVENVVDSVQDHCNGLIVPSSQEVTEGLEAAQLAERDHLLVGAARSQIGDGPGSLFLRLEITL